MIQVVRALAGLCCDGDHATTQTPPYAVLAIDGPDEAYIVLCSLCARHLMADLHAVLTAVERQP